MARRKVAVEGGGEAVLILMGATPWSSWAFSGAF